MIVLNVIIIFAITTVITRWVFKVNKFEALLKEISKKMDDLAKTPPF